MSSVSSPIVRAADVFQIPLTVLVPDIVPPSMVMALLIYESVRAVPSVNADMEAVPVTSNSVETDAFAKVQGPVILSAADRSTKLVCVMPPKESAVAAPLTVNADMEAVPVTSNSVEKDAFAKVQGPVMDCGALLDAGPLSQSSLTKP